MNIPIEVSKIFKKYTGIDFLEEQQLQTEDLFGSKIGLSPRDLVEIYMEINIKLDKRIKESCFIERRLKTFNDFIETLE